ncbi:MAG: hypothetical protein JWQ87_54 [Candidatus Sulfotelmatobacter sp.]|nr:hypothetical protein [Candidatus Sulfotelmatobacter sp.]
MDALQHIFGSQEQDMLIAGFEAVACECDRELQCATRSTNAKNGTGIRGGIMEGSRPWLAEYGACSQNSEGTHVFYWSTTTVTCAIW